MVAMSRTFGTRRSTIGSSASSVAASAGSAAFLAPLAATVPIKGVGPVMRKRSIGGRASLADAPRVHKAKGGLVGMAEQEACRERSVAAQLDDPLDAGEV